MQHLDVPFGVSGVFETWFGGSPFLLLFVVRLMLHDVLGEWWVGILSTDELWALVLMSRREDASLAFCYLISVAMCVQLIALLINVVVSACTTHGQGSEGEAMYSAKINWRYIYCV